MKLAAPFRGREAGAFSCLARHQAMAVVEMTCGAGVSVLEIKQFLINKLLSATMTWRDALYVPAFVNAPKVIDTDVGSDGSLSIGAAAEGTRAPAQHISNSSDMRATLLSFLIAFWHHLMEVRGGLSLLLIDDVQELFDRDNRRRVANTIPLIVENAGRIIATTNDTSFGKRVAANQILSMLVDANDDLDERIEARRVRQEVNDRLEGTPTQSHRVVDEAVPDVIQVVENLRAELVGGDRARLEAPKAGEDVATEKPTHVDGEDIPKV